MFEPQDIYYTDDGRYAIVKKIVSTKLEDRESRYYFFTERDGKTILGKLAKIERTRGPSEEYHGWDAKDKDVAIVEYHDGKTISMKSYYHPINSNIVGNDCRKYKSEFYDETGKLQISRKYYPVIVDDSCSHYKYCDQEYVREILREERCYDESVNIPDEEPRLHAEDGPAYKKYDETGKLKVVKYYLNGVEVDQEDVRSKYNPSIVSTTEPEETIDTEETNYSEEPETKPRQKIRVKGTHYRRVRREEPESESEEPDSESSEDIYYFIEYPDMNVVFADKKEFARRITEKKCAPYIAIFSSKEVIGTGNSWIALVTYSSLDINEIFEDRDSTVENLKVAIDEAWNSKRY